METLNLTKEELLKIYTALFLVADETLKMGLDISNDYLSAMDKVRRALTS